MMVCSCFSRKYGTVVIVSFLRRKSAYTTTWVRPKDIPNNEKNNFHQLFGRGWNYCEFTLWIVIGPLENRVPKKTSTASQNKHLFHNVITRAQSIAVASAILLELGFQLVQYLHYPDKTSLDYYLFKNWLRGKRFYSNKDVSNWGNEFLFGELGSILLCERDKPTGTTLSRVCRREKKL